MDTINSDAGTVPAPSTTASAPALARRSFLARCTAGAALVGAGALAGCGGTENPAPGGVLGGDPLPTPTATTIQPVTDTDLLVLMLQLEYLNAEYFSAAVLGGPLPAALVAGAGTAGPVTGGQPVAFTGTLADQMRELAAQKVDRIVRLRAVLGAAAPARPAINLGVDASGVFTKYGVDAAAFPANKLPAPVITNVYADQDQFLLGAFILQDPLMNAWRGVTPMMVSQANVELGAGMTAAAAAHAGLVRSQLYIRGGATTTSKLRQNSIYLSDLRDSYAPSDDDAGVGTSTTGTGGSANITPTDGQGLVFNRLVNFTLNTFFMTGLTATSGGFFPSGVNGAIRQSANITIT